MLVGVAIFLLVSSSGLTPVPPTARVGDLNTIIASEDPAMASRREAELRNQLSSAGVPAAERALLRAALARALHLQGKFDDADKQHDQVPLTELQGPENRALLAQILFNAAETNRQLERWDETAALARQALAIREQLKAKGPIADSQLQLGIAHLELKQHAVARRLIESALSSRLMTLGPTAVRTVNAEAWLARLAAAQGEGPAAVQILQRVYLRRQAAGDPAVTSEAASELAAALESIGKLADAEPLRREAIALVDRSDNQLVSWLRGDLAHNLALQEKWSEAERELRNALAVLEVGTGSSDFDLRVLLSDLANVYHHSGRSALALPLLKRVLVAEEAELGPAHPDVADTLSVMAAAHIRIGQAANALSLLARARDINMARGQKSALSLTERMLSSVYLGLRRMDEADAAADRALAVSSSDASTLDHAHNLDMKSAIAAARHRSREWAGYARASLQIRKVRLGWGHRETQSVASDLISALRNVAELDKAEDVAREWSNALAGSSDTRAQLVALSTLAHTLVQQERWVEAASVLGQVLNRASGKKTDGLSSYAADAWAGLAQIESVAGRFDRAEPMYRRALADWRKIPASPNRNRNVAAISRHLGATLVKMGRKREAEPFLREARALFRQIDGSEDFNAAWAATALAETLAEGETTSQSRRLYGEALARFRKGEMESWLLEPLEGLGRLELTKFFGNPSAAQRHLSEAAKVAIADVSRVSGEAAHERLKRRQSIFVLLVQSSWQLSKQ